MAHRELTVSLPSCLIDSLAMTRQKLNALSAKSRRLGIHQYLEIDRLAISTWRVEGGDRWIVFIHGNSACKEVFAPQIEALANSGYSLLAIDLPGHGGSEDAIDPASQYTIPGYALLFRRLLAHLGVQAPLLVGWSLGGHIALEMIGRGFDIAAAMIVGTAPAGPGSQDLEAALLPSPFVSVTTRSDASEDEIKRYTENLYGSLNPIPKLLIEAGLRTDGHARERMGAHWIQGDEGCHQKTVAAGTSQPICVVHGMDDPFISHAYLKSIVWRNLWRGSVHELDGIGHCAFLEAPDRLTEILAEFSKDVFDTPPVAHD